MKTSHKHIIAALAVTLALASCTKDVIAEKEDVNPQDGGLRTIAVSFGASTKSYLDDDGVTPIFEEGDEIAVSNYKEEKQVSVERNEKGDLYFTTTLQGELVAIYPSSKASFEAGKPGFKVPVEQTGLFKDANIALAKIGEDQTYATFVNQTAVLKFYIGPEIGVKSIKISSNSQLATDNSKIVVEVAKLRDSKVIDPQERICYVAVLPGVSQMTVESFTSTQTVEDAGGCVKREFQNVNLTCNTLANVFIPYYIPVNVGTEAEPENQYWAYCNVGAFLPEEPGLYFAWGDTQGHRLDANSNQFEGGHSFTWANCPFNGGSEDFSSTAFEAAKATAFPSGTLVLGCDAANVNWGDKWRMPTGTEFGVLVANLSKDWDNTNKGCKVYDKSAKTVFFPAASYGFGTSLVSMNFFDGSYWSSSLKPDDDQSGQILYINPTTDGLAESNSAYRFVGYPIRPIFGDPAPEENGLKISGYKQGQTL